MTWRPVRRLGIVVGVVAVVAAACGSGRLSLAEYVEEIDAIQSRAHRQYAGLIASPEGEVLAAEGERLLEFTPQDLQVGLERVAELQDEVLDAINGLDPPDSIADLHELFYRRLPIEELAARAGTAANWEELSNSSEMAAYRDQLASDKAVCSDFQATLDDIENRGVFVDVPWVPSELVEIADDALSCDALPDNPQDMYRPPPSS